MLEKFQLLRVRQFSDVLNDSIAFVKGYIKPISYVILIMVVPVYVLGSFFYSSSLASMVSMSQAQNLFHMREMAAGGILAAFALLIGRLLLTVIFVTSFITVEYSESGALDHNEIFAGIKHNISRLIGFYFLVILMAAVIGALAVMIFAALVSIAATEVVALMVLVLSLLGVYLGISLAFTPIIYIREMCGFGEAVSRSFYLVKNNWWWTFLIFLVAAIIGGLAGYIFTLPYTIIMTMKTFTSSNMGHTGLDLDIVDRVALTFSNSGSIVSTSVVTIAMFIQYYSLVEKKDGVSLMQKIDSIGTRENFPY